MKTIRSLTKSSLIALSLLAAGSTSQAVEATLLQDAKVTGGGLSNINYGDAKNTEVDSNAAPSLGYIKFDTELVFATDPTPNQIAKATLRLYVLSAKTPGSIGITVVTSPWQENTIRYNNLPAAEPAPVYSFPVPATAEGDFITIDVTALVRDWVTGNRVNHGIALVPVGSVNVKFDSKENVETSHPPHLDITLTSNTWLNGTVDPIAITGADGDFYLNTSAYTFFGPKTANGWGLGTSIIGPIGIQGSQGIQGIQGTAGVPGLKGDTGTIGLTGLTGPAGVDGTNGTNGKTWLAGIGIPSMLVGVDGDFYLDTTNSTFYGPKTGTGWGAGTSIVGAVGPIGPVGPQGAAPLRIAPTGNLSMGAFTQGPLP